MNTAALAQDWDSFSPPSLTAIKLEAQLPTMPAEVDFAMLDERRIDLTRPPKKPVPVFILSGQPICTAGNLTVISAQVKSGKSAVVGANVSATVAADSGNDDADTLGFTSAPTNGKAVIVFDTEQSRYDSWSLIDRACQRAGVKEQPGNLRAYSLLDVPTATRRVWLAAEMERASVDCGGIHAVLIDGVADLCVDPNNAEESFPLVEELVQLAVQHDCPLIVVLHENPAGAASATGKTRGHLGSQLERKAESNLRIVKDVEGISTIFSEKCRSASIPKAYGICFAWCSLLGRHVTVEADKADAKRGEQAPIVEAVFEGVVGALTWAELMERMERHAKLKGSTAERRIRLWQSLGIIKKSARGYLLA